MGPLRTCAVAEGGHALCVSAGVQAGGPAQGRLGCANTCERHSSGAGSWEGGSGTRTGWLGSHPTSFRLTEEGGVSGSSSQATVSRHNPRSQPSDPSAGTMAYERRACLPAVLSGQPPGCAPLADLRHLPPQNSQGTQSRRARSSAQNSEKTPLSSEQKTKASPWAMRVLHDLSPVTPTAPAVGAFLLPALAFSPPTSLGSVLGTATCPQTRPCIRRSCPHSSHPCRWLISYGFCLVAPSPQDKSPRRSVCASSTHVLNPGRLAATSLPCASGGPASVSRVTHIHGLAKAALQALMWTLGRISYRPEVTDGVSGRIGGPGWHGSPFTHLPLEGA